MPVPLPESWMRFDMLRLVFWHLPVSLIEHDLVLSRVKLSTKSFGVNRQPFKNAKFFTKSVFSLFLIVYERLFYDLFMSLLSNIFIERYNKFHTHPERNFRSSRRIFSVSDVAWALDIAIGKVIRVKDTSLLRYCLNTTNNLSNRITQSHEKMRAVPAFIFKTVSLISDSRTIRPVQGRIS